MQLTVILNYSNLEIVSIGLTYSEILTDWTDSLILSRKQDHNYTSDDKLVR